MKVKTFYEHAETSDAIINDWLSEHSDYIIIDHKFQVIIAGSGGTFYFTQFLFKIES